MKETVLCDMNPNQPVRIEVEKCLLAHSIAIRTAIMDRKTGRTREYEPCLKCPTALSLKENRKPMEKENTESINVSSSPEVHPESKKTAVEDGLKKKTAFCKECKEEKKIIGRGLCGSCYCRLKRLRQLDKYPAQPQPWVKAGSRSQKPTSEGLNSRKKVPETLKTQQSHPVSFLLDRIDTVPGLMDFLKNRMKDGFRETLENQILFELRNSMQLYEGIKP